MRVLVTGGAGYIGSHICVAALEAGHDVAIFDNYRNSNPAVLLQIGEIIGRPCTELTGDIRDPAEVADALRRFRPDTVIHLAGLKAVGESVAKPLEYFETNVQGTAVLLAAMARQSVRRLVFSSSATVYGTPVELPLTENHPLDPASPYGRSKLMAEWLCRDFQKANPGFGAVILRYFNPIGSHPSGLIGEDPRDHPNNLMPYIAQVARGLRQCLDVFGTDYPTPDGTGVRDYLHVCDLAEAHVAALSRLDRPGTTTLNLGTGEGHSVFAVVRAFEQATGMLIPVNLAARREGDVAAYYADPGLASAVLGWRSRRSLKQMCRDAWEWQRRQMAREGEIIPAAAE